MRAELATLQRQQRQGRQRWKALLTETGLYTPEALKRFKYQLALCHHEDCLLQDQISALRSQLKALHDEQAGVQSAIHKLQIAQEKVDIIKEL
ncbi:hypothetical protein CIG19_14675 [Enterobacterales bacterium CwR94]|nr:hypothetical protein CIG19_14675 [Enterobacterales bacterium CwR94]